MDWKGVRFTGWPIHYIRFCSLEFVTSHIFNCLVNKSWLFGNKIQSKPPELFGGFVADSVFLRRSKKTIRII